MVVLLRPKLGSELKGGIFTCLLTNIMQNGEKGEVTYRCMSALPFPGLFTVENGVRTAFGWEHSREDLAVAAAMLLVPAVGDIPGIQHAELSSSMRDKLPL